MSERRRKFTPEYREEAVKAVIETSRPIAQVARELGIVKYSIVKMCQWLGVSSSGNYE